MVARQQKLCVIKEKTKQECSQTAYAIVVHTVHTDCAWDWWPFQADGTRVFTLIKWTGLWAQACLDPGLGPQSETTLEMI